MIIESCPSKRFVRVTLAVACIAFYGVALGPTEVRAGSLVIPAWSFARGNVQINADPDEFADAGPVVVSGPRAPWGWSVEYDVNIPVTGVYRLYVKYASAETRPVEVYFDTRNVSKVCTGISLSTTAAGSWKSSAARWELLRSRFGGPDPVAAKRNGAASAGVHTIKLVSRRPLPHLVALRLDTPAAFPDDWTPPKFRVRDIDSVPAKYRGAFAPAKNIDVEAMRRPAPEPPRPRASGSLTIPAWSFDRGNVRIYASPDKFANAGPLIGSAPEHTGRSVAEYDIDFPASGQYTIQANYTSFEARPVEILLDGKSVGKFCNSVGFNSPPYELPIRTSGDSWDAKWDMSSRVTMSVTKGKHTLKLARDGKFPHLVAFKLETPAAFGKGWKQPPRPMRQFDRVPVRERSVFLPADAVNIGALRSSIEHMIETYGPRYSRGSDYLKQLAEFEKKQRTVSVAKPIRKSFLMARTWAGETVAPDAKSANEQALKSLRRRAMLDHPALKFDKLLFLKREPVACNSYSDPGIGGTDGNLCILSPVSADGKVTRLVEELKDGAFSRFNLSFDARKVVFGFKKKGGNFRIYEIGVDPTAGKMIPGSLRQLTFDPTEKVPLYRGGMLGVDDMDPCYLPNGKIMFASTRSERHVFCAGPSVTTLYLMEPDGKNMRRLSAGTLSEMEPCVMDDGRIIYTRWEYVDKGLGNGQSVWSVRPDGSGVDHVYKNSILRPAQMLHTRNIPGSQRLITVGAPHCGARAGGPVILVDNRNTRRDRGAMDCITPEIAYPCMHQFTWHMGYFLNPHPFSEKFFLVSHKPGTKDSKHYGIYALDAWGNRAELCSDPKISCYQPVPLRARLKPMQVAEVEKTSAKQQTGVLFIQDVYEGMKGIKRGRVKYVRVMGVLPWPWRENGIFRIGHSGNVHRKRVYGVAKVCPDGSAHFTAPASENIFFQLLDENYMQLQHMPTFINLSPGESRSCIGCHEHRKQAPGIRVRPMAIKLPAQKLIPQPGDTGPRMVHYASDVQPVLDKHCVGCHSGKRPKGRLDLTGVLTESWNRSYENIMGKGLVSTRQCGFGRSGFRPAEPLSFGSHLSKLAARMRSKPCKAKITQGEFVRIVTWIDANAPYYGTYRGKRGLQDIDEPDFRMTPVVSAK